MNTKLAPICLFTYNRLLEARRTVEALQRNYLAAESELFVFSDGPKNAEGVERVKEVRKYLRTISGFKNITILESPGNKGLAKSIITGVTEIIRQSGRVLVMEDDLVGAPNFLDFVNQALDFYQHDPAIHSISGYSLDLPSLRNYPKDYYLGYRASSWGWGTWKERWETTDWEVTQYKNFKKNPIQQIRFMRGGSDMPRMLKRQMKGKIDTWDIRWCFDQFMKNQLTVFPTKSKIIGIGFGPDATHTKRIKQFGTILDNGKQRQFIFDENPQIDKALAKEFRHKFSICSRLINKVM